MTAGKCASGSLKRLVYHLQNIDNQEEREEIKITTDDIARKYYPKKYLKIGIYREPVDRLMSCWRDKMKRHFFKGFKFVNGLRPGMNFNDFAKVVCDTPDEISDGHFRSQSCFYIKGEIFLPDIFVDFDDLPFGWAMARRAVKKHCGKDIPGLPVGKRKTGDKPELEPEPLDTKVFDMLQERYEKDYALKRFVNHEHP
jgi:hypothetical protein